MLDLLWYELPNSEGRTRSFRAKTNSRPFHFSNCRREFPRGLEENVWKSFFRSLGPTGQSIVERVQVTGGDQVAHLIIDREILVVRVSEPTAWEDVMRRVTEAVRDLSEEEVVVEIENPTPQVSQT